MRMIVARCALAAMVLLSPALRAAELPNYRLDAVVDPEARELSVDAVVEVPANLAGTTIEFLLASPLRIESADPAVTSIAADDAAGFSGINGSSAALGKSGRAARYRLQLAPGQSSFKLRYSGRVDFGFDTPAQEYARGFNETAGTIQKDGIYLAGSTLWYPYFGDTLFTFEITAKSPEGWQLISPGAGTARGADGITRWKAEMPIDEMHLVGGVLTKYTRAAGTVRAEVYLRKPDEALANRYLESTARNLEMYRGLIGPYPYTKFSLVENFWETGYGMPSFTLLGPQIIRFPFILTSSYPHEILHNWWGNSVYVDYLTGNWCEGLTAYLADHLYKEQQGQGAEYRRDTLKKYRDFVGEAHDFPLSEFRSRHSPATEAVGYGKALMLFHMVRRQIGDDAFRAGLQRFYRENRGKRASFTDFRKSMEAASKADLAPLFKAFVERTGAPDLRLANVRTRAKDGVYTVTGSITQVQAGEQYVLDVPVSVRTAAGIETTTVRTTARSTAFSIVAKAEPQLIELDPEFDLFRLLDVRETAPSLGQMFGEANVLVVVPANASAAERSGWDKMVEFWSGGTQRFEIRTDAEIKSLPKDRAVWIFGRGNALAARWFGSDAGIAYSVDADGISARDGRIPFAGHSAVIVRRHPANPAKAIGWITADPLEAMPGLARKLPHYGKYSYLGFAGTEPANMAKGEWAAVDSPLRADVRSKATRAAAALGDVARTKRAALASLPPAFDPAALRAHVEFLAAPEREGRGIGSAGLEAAGDYIATAFAKAGLAPFGAAGYFQNFDVTVAGKKGPQRVRNVIGILPGSNPAFDGQSVILSAHYDHLGRDGRGVRVAELGQVHPGADDNASGVAVLLETARTLASEGKPLRTIVFVAFSAEEEGLLGSKHFLANPGKVDVAGIRSVVNLDTVGRLGTGELSVLAAGTATEWQHVFRGISFTTGVPTRSIAGAGESSDQQSFIAQGIPAVQLFTSAHLDYHRPTDTAEKIDIDGLVKISLVVKEALGYLVQRPTPLTITIDRAALAQGAAQGGAAANGSPGAAPARRVSFGIVPDYAEAKGGVRVESVVPGSPAALAGITGGDILQQIDGKPTATLGAFSDVLKTLQPGQEVLARLRRGDRDIEARVKLTER
jgi:aminopeptidase N